MATIEEVLARLASLEEQVRALTARLNAEDEQPRRLMRDTRRCPACRGGRILFVEQFQPLQNMPLRVSYQGVFSIKSLGMVQATVCAGCGFAEMQIDDPASLQGVTGVRELEALPAGEGGPYR